MLVIECADPMPTVLLPASLYSSWGKLAVEITSLGDDRAMVISSKRPPVGSFAYLVRNGTKVPAQIAWTAGASLGLSFFEEPLDGAWRERTFKV